jgi:micrococcal nuclease
MNSKESLRNTSLYLFFGLCLISIGLAIFSFKKTETVQIIFTPAPPAISTSSATFAKVTRVIDGDTIVINTGEHIRYIGMNAPELSPQECYATEAADINKNLVLGKTIKLVKDVSETDKYGRPLRFVYIGDIFVDDYLVKVGAAKIETVPPDTEFKDEFLSSQNYAKENKLGLWGEVLLKYYYYV